MTTRTTDASVTAAVVAAFHLGKPQAPLLAYERQWAGQAWVLTTDRGRWLARQLFDWFDESAVDVEVGLAEAAAAAGIGTPRSRHGGTFTPCVNPERAVG